MKKVHTKDHAEAILRELPSVLGAFVREDVYGQPRDVHILVGPGPEPRLLARDIRDLLEERLGVPVDQRVISIAQLSERFRELPLEEMAAPAECADPAAPATAEDCNADDAPPAPQLAVGAATASTAPSGVAGPTAPRASGSTAAPAGRLVFHGIESATRSGRTEVHVRVSWRGEMFEGVAEEIEGGHGRVRASAAATLRAATAACGETVRLDLDAAAVVSTLGRDYVLVSALAVSPLLGRRPLALSGAYPFDAGAETAAALAALHATNRVLGLALRGQSPGRSGVSA